MSKMRDLQHSREGGIPEILLIDYFFLPRFDKISALKLDVIMVVSR